MTHTLSETKISDRFHEEIVFAQQRDHLHSGLYRSRACSLAHDDIKRTLLSPDGACGWYKAIANQSNTLSMRSGMRIGGTTKSIRPASTPRSMSRTLIGPERPSSSGWWNPTTGLFFAGTLSISQPETLGTVPGNSWAF